MIDSFNGVSLSLRDMYAEIVRSKFLTEDKADRLTLENHKFKNEIVGLKIDLVELKTENEELQKQLKELRAKLEETETDCLLAQVDANYATLGE